MNDELNNHDSRRLIVEVLDGFHAGSYDCKVLETESTFVRVEMPKRNGLPLPLAVGQKVRVTSPQDDDFVFASTISRRVVGSLSYIEIIKPDVFQNSLRKARIIAVTSGKGGVGKTNFTVAFAMSLAELGNRILIIDADMGLANVDVLLGVRPQFDLTDVFSGQKQLPEIITDAPGGLKIIAGGSGIEDLANLSENQLSAMIEGFNELDKLADVILIDTGAGIAKNVTSFVLSSDSSLLVTTPEPTSLADAYAMLKVLLQSNKSADISLVVNRAESVGEAEGAYRRLAAVARNYLNYELKFAGFVHDDNNVTHSVKKQASFYRCYPGCSASRCVRRIAHNVSGSFNDSSPESTAGVKGFLSRLRNHFGISNVR